jgi:hypothetical protein
MKGFIHQVESNDASKAQAKEAYDSFTSHGWDVEIVNGVTPQTLEHHLFPYQNLFGGRLDAFAQNEPAKYNTKKSCLFNNLKFAVRVLELNEPMVFIEHDAICIAPLPDIEFEDFCFMAYEYAFAAPTVLNKAPFNTYSNISNEGVNSFPTDYPLRYYRPTKYKGETMTPGTMCYALSPSGAAKILDAASTGLDQSDFIINSGVVKMQYLYPSPVKFNTTNLNLSHGL